MAKKSNFQNFCKTFCFAAVTPALLNAIKQHFHSKMGVRNVY